MSAPVFEKEVLEKDALNRIRWDPSLVPSEFSIEYIDLGRSKTVLFTDIELSGDFFRLDDSLIPVHRVRRIFWKDRVVWDKRRI